MRQTACEVLANTLCARLTLPDTQIHRSKYLLTQVQVRTGSHANTWTQAQACAHTYTHTHTHHSFHFAIHLFPFSIYVSCGSVKHAVTNLSAAAAL